MGKRKSRSRNASPESKRSSSLTEGVKQDVITPEVVVSPSTPTNRRVSARSRYAQERPTPTPDKEDNSRAETPKRNRNQSSSPPSKRKKKRKGKRQQQEEEDEEEPSDNEKSTPEEPTEEKEADQNQVTNVDTSDVDAPRDPDVGKKNKAQKAAEQDQEGATAKVVKEGASVSGHSSVDEGRHNSDSDYKHRSDNDHRSHHEHRQHQGDDRYDHRHRADHESSRDRPRGGRWDSPQHQRSDHQDHRRRHHSPEKKPPNIKTFPVGDSVVVVAKHPETLSLWGCTSVRSLLNNVDTCGFILRQGAPAIDIFSASSTSFVTIATTLPSNTPHNDIKKSLDEINGLDKSTKKEILSVVDSESTVLMFAEPVGKQRLDFATSVAPFQQIFWSKENEEAGRRYLQLGSLPVAVALDAGVKQIRISHEMKKASEQFCSSIQKGEAPTIAVCGGKNVGKSTMGRYLTNCALNKCPQVAYLECDVGQTEYSPPGCVSLHLISDPVLGPPFTHQRHAHKMLYFGAVTPSDDPQYYLSCVKAAYTAYTSLTQPCPLVVNTMGWNEGLGLILLASTVSITHPKYVVQFESNNRNRNLPPVTPQFVTEQERWPTMLEDTKEKTPTHDLFTIQSQIDVGKFRDRYHPADHRTLSLLGYLSRLQAPSGPCLPLHALPPQSVPWGSVAVHVSHAAVPNSQVMYALNASIVGLCRVPEDTLLSPEDDSLPKFLAEKPVCECIGFGIVRSIDPENKVFQILTDLTLDSHTGINCLLRGTLELPQSLIVNQGLKEFKPFSLHPRLGKKYMAKYKPAGRKHPKHPNQPGQPNRGNHRGGRGGGSRRGDRGSTRGASRGGNRGASHGSYRGGSHGTDRGTNRDGNGGTNSGSNHGSYQGSDRGGNFGTDCGSNRGMARGGYQGTNRGGNRGAAHTGIDGADGGSIHRTDHGANHRKYQGGNLGTDRGGNRGTDRGGNLGTDHGGNRGGNRGTDRGGNRGTDHGGNRGMDRGGSRGSSHHGSYCDTNRGGNHGTDHGSYRGSGHGSYRGSGHGSYRGSGHGSYRGSGHGSYRGSGHGSYRGSGHGSYRGTDRGGNRGRQTAKLAWGEETKNKEHAPKTFGHNHSRNKSSSSKSQTDSIDNVDTLDKQFHTAVRLIP